MIAERLGRYPRQTAAPYALAQALPPQMWLSFFCFVLCFSASLSGQLASPPNSTEETDVTSGVLTPDKQTPSFQRIFVPEDQVGKLVPRDYMPIAVDDLESLLETFQLGESSEWETQPRITHALYVARLQGDELLSEMSVWEMQYQNDVAAYLPIRPWNVAISNPLASPMRDLMSWGEPAEWHVDSTDALWLPVNDSTPLWFGWRGLTTESPLQTKTFSLQVPAATRNQMLLLLNAGIDVQCSEGVVQEVSIANPDVSFQNIPIEKFHSTLSTWTTRYANKDSRLWLIDFSGGNKLTLSFEAALVNPIQNRQAIVGSLLQQYRLQEAGLELVTRIGMIDGLDTSHMYLDVQPPLKVREIKLGDQLLSWTMVPEHPNKLRLALDNIGDSKRITQLQISAFVSTDDLLLGQLPAISVSDSIVLRGDTVLECRAPLVPLDVQADGAEKYDSSESDGQESGTKRRWQWRWSGRTPAIHIETSPVERIVEASSLTRINLIKGSLSATSWVRLVPQIKAGGEARLLLGEGWILDSLSAEPGSNLMLDENVLPEGTEVLLRWDSYTSADRLTIEIQAHRAIETDVGDIVLSEMNFLQLRNGKQSGVVAVETTGRYLVKPTPTMLSLLRDEAEVSTWQKDKLPRFSRSWLLDANDGKIPELSFTSEPSTFTGTWDVFLRPESNELAEEYRLQFRPLFGAMDRVLVRFRNSRQSELLWQWDDGDRKYTLQATREVNESGSETYLIILPRPVNEPFTLTSKRVINDAGWSLVPLPASDQATSEELVLHISKLIETKLPESGWISIFADGTGEAEEFATFRAESNLAESVAVSLNDPTDGTNAWALKARHEHRLFSDGTLVSEAIWEMANCAGESLTISLPTGAKCSDVRFGNLSLPFLQKENDSTTVVIDLPTELSSGTLRAIYTEIRPPLSFRNPVALKRATLNCGVVQEEMAVLAPALYSPVRIEDFTNLYGSTLLRQVGNFSRQLLFGGESTSAIFAQSTTALESESTGYIAEQMASVTNWHRFPLATHEASATDTSIVLWDTRCLRSVVLLMWLTLGVLASWGWSRLPRGMIAASISLMAMAMVFPHQLGLASAGALIAITLAGLIACAKTSLYKAKAKTQISFSVRSHNSITRKATPLSLFWVILAASFATIASTNDALAQESADKTYGILIPFSPEGEIKGKYVYVPIEAYNLLTNPGGRSFAPRTPYMIRQATYQFRMSEGVTNSNSFSYQMVADFEIEVIDPAVPIRWPIGKSAATLERLVVNQFEIIPGFTVRQDSSTITWFPERSGLFRIRLQLRPEKLAADAERFEMGIPMVPTNSLTVVAPSNKRINAQGSNLDSVANAGAAYQFGPTNRLTLEIMDRNEAEGEPKPLDGEVDAWLHFQTNSVVLLTQCRMRYGDGVVPKKINLQMDSSWRPVGVTWGDAKWNGITTVASNSTLNSYELAIQSTSMTEANIFTAWLPAGDWIGAEVAPQIFPESKWLNPVLYTLSTSSSSDAQWRLAVPDSWSPEAADRAFVRWGSRSPIQAGESYSSISRAGQPIIKNVELPTYTELTEQCDCTIRRDHVEIAYELNWQGDGKDRDIVLIAVPPDCQIRSLSVNNIPAEDYSFVSRGRKTYLAVAIAANEQDATNKIVCTAAMPNTTTVPQNIPRLTAESDSIVSSIYQLYREANLSVQLEGIDLLPESRQMLERSSEEMLKSDQIGMMRLELTDRFSGSPWLPVQYSVSKTNPNVKGSVLGLLLVNSDRWSYSLLTKLRSASQPIDSLIFEIPASITSQIQIEPPCPFRLDPSPDGAHQLLSLFPDQPITAEQTHRISFDLVKVTGQVSLPTVTLIGGGEITQRIGLPQLDGNHNYTWRTTALRPEPIPVEFESLMQSVTGAGAINWQFLEPTSRRYQADLQSDKSNSPKITVKLATHEIQPLSDQHCLVRSTFWLDPEGFLAARFKIPPGLNLIGAIENGAPQQVQKDAASGLHSIAIEPSNLPTKLELILRSDEVVSLSELKFDFPYGENLEVELSHVRLLEADAFSENVRSALFMVDQEMVAPVPDEDVRDGERRAIVSLLTNADASISSYSPGLLRDWAKTWQRKLTELDSAKSEGDEGARWRIRLLEISNSSGVSADTSESTVVRSPIVSLTKKGDIKNVRIQFESEPLQVQLSWLAALVLTITTLVWLVYSGSQVHYWLGRAAETPAIPLTVASAILGVLLGSWLVASFFLLLALISLSMQLYLRWTARKSSPPALTASKR
jgi:hypothetical protein